MTLRPSTMSIAALALVGALAGSGGASAQSVDAASPTLSPSLTAPDPAGPPTRGIWLRDPAGQIERITANGHLIAWTVRTPADTLRADGSVRPVRMPTETIVAVADERGGQVVKIALRRKYVRELRLVRGTTNGPAGNVDSAAAPRLAVRSCTGRRASSCRDEVLMLSSTAPLQAIGSETPANARAVLAGRVDLGRSLDIAKRQDRPRSKRCLPRLAITDLTSRKERRLPKLRTTDRIADGRCLGLRGLLLRGNYAFATVGGESDDGLYSEAFYALDSALGSAARWRLAQRPFRVLGESAQLTIGPAVTDTAVWFQELDIDSGAAASMHKIELPREARVSPSGAPTANITDPVAPGSSRGCALVATDDALYELANRRCERGFSPALVSDGEVRRLSGVLPLR